MLATEPFFTTLLGILLIHDEVLPLGGLIWAAVGKDPGFTPVSLLEIVKRL